MLNEVTHRLITFFGREVSLVLWDIADITLVALVVYFVLSLIKGTRAVQMGIGLALVFAVYQVSKRLGLVTLYTMLDTLLTSLVLIIVVVFQQDIRRALMRFGRRPLFTPARAALETYVIEEVVKAASSLAHKRVGALMVFERDALLDEFIDEGTILDAAVSKELLYSIFIPSYENPMHDGAVIIRDGRVYQAGAFLPLTASTKLDKTLGTRHRAAIGLSEDTDAAVVVVSEERGSVSLCFNGNIVHNLDAASLRTALLGLLTKQRARSSRASSAGDAAVPARMATRSRPPQPEAIEHAASASEVSVATKSAEVEKA
ncbi:MAG: diadenylate cyclase CdaA [Polyangiales bacterium]